MNEIEIVRSDLMTDLQALAIARLIVATWPKEGRTAEKTTSNMLVNSHSREGKPEQYDRYFTIWDGTRVVANSHVFPRRIRTPHGEMVVMALAAVCADAKRRGEGLGKIIVQAAFGLVDRGVFPISLYQTTPSVRPFYEKLGAREIHNPIVNSKAPDPQARPFWDPVAMIYPADFDWPEGEIDILGEGY
jgi:GNAT superfamily N-acetyltransferase